MKLRLKITNPDAMTASRHTKGHVAPWIRHLGGQHGSQIAHAKSPATKETV